MNREEMERVFCWKISAELKLFQIQILKKEKEEIYDMAYQIDSVIRIYELLVEESQRLGQLQLEYCIAAPSLLMSVYRTYLEKSITDNRDQGLLTTFRDMLEEVGQDVA